MVMFAQILWMVDGFWGEFVFRKMFSGEDISKNFIEKICIIFKPSLNDEPVSDDDSASDDDN